MEKNSRLNWFSLVISYALILLAVVLVSLAVKALLDKAEFGAGAVTSWALTSIFRWYQAIRDRKVGPKLGWSTIIASLVVALTLLYCFLFI